MSSRFISIPGCIGLILSSALLRAQSFDIPGQDSPEASWWRDSMRARDERLGSWREARFGMFVHWGVYSGLGNEYRGRKGGGYAEHIQRVLKIPIPEYREEVAGIFNPTNFNADEWIRTATNAGMGYFVITAKHHDGFAMWPTRVNDYNIIDATPFDRDPMKELRDACHKYGLKFGFYYSHAFDWGEENAPGNDWDYDNPGGDRLLGGRNWWETRSEFINQARKYVDEKAIPQLLELIHNYDPDILWFDTPHKLPPSENLRILKVVREAAPNVVINGRLVRGWGDYESTADRPAEFSPHEGDWEGIPTTNESYGWNRLDHSHKPASHFIQLLAKAAARGGNLLMNIGPMGNGEIDPKDLEILHGIGKWWNVNGESIRGTTRTPLAVQTWGESTRKGNMLYLHVFEWPKNGKLVVGGLKSDVKSARLLANVIGSASAEMSQSLLTSAPANKTRDYDKSSLEVRRRNSLDVEIKVPDAAPDNVDSVVVIECSEQIETDKTRLLQPSFASDTLRVFDAELRGSGLRFGAGKVRDAYVTGLSRPDQSIIWPARIDVPATFEVEITYDAEKASAGDSFVVNLGSETLTGKVKPGKIRTDSLGRVTLQPGEVPILIRSRDINGDELMRPRSLTLKTISE